MDTVTSVDGARAVIRTAKHVSMAEEYLADHFPSFPVLPGVMMLEAAVQSAAWLLHLRHDFARSMAVLRESRNVRYGRFVAPGDALHLTVEHLKDTDAGAGFKFVGLTGGGDQAVAGRIELAYFNLADRGGDPEADRRLIAHRRRAWDALASMRVALGGTPLLGPRHGPADPGRVDGLISRPDADAPRRDHGEGSGRLDGSVGRR